MEFNDHKPIYLQIADTVCDKLLSGEWNAEDRVPSVRELGMTLGVNPNTIMRSYEYLQTINVIYNKRGVGYFVDPSAKDAIINQERRIFLEEELPKILNKMKLLNISPEDIFSIKIN